jgi:hypothetical protein
LVDATKKGVFVMSEEYERTSNGRFPKGQSGNRKGRPRKDRSVNTIILDAANELITAHHGGRQRKMPKLRATATQMANKGASGDLRAGKMLLDYAAKAEEQHAAKVPAEVPLTLSDQEIADAFLAEYRRSLGMGG